MVCFQEMGGHQRSLYSRNRNRSGRRYGFIRFKGVSNVQYLEQQLDNIVLEGLKLHVNVPKHGRDLRVAEKEDDVARVEMIMKDKGIAKEVCTQPDIGVGGRLWHGRTLEHRQWQFLVARRINKPAIERQDQT